METGLSVKEFIEQTLLDVCSAVESAREQYRYIAPQVFANHADDTSSLVSFDMAVTVAENESKEITSGAKVGAKFGISVMKAETSLNDNKQQQTGSNISTVSRIKVNIPVYFRHSKEKEEEHRDRVNKIRKSNRT